MSNSYQRAGRRVLRVGAGVGSAVVVAVLSAAVLTTRRLPGDSYVAHQLGRPRRDHWQPLLTHAVAVVSPTHDAVALLVVAGLVSVYRRSWRPLCYALFVAVLTTAALVALKAGTWRAGPQGRPSERTGGSFPSGHLTWLLVGGESLLVLLRRASGWRWALGIVLVALGFALIRLRDHWLSDLLGALALGGLLLGLVGWLRVRHRMFLAG